MIYFYCDKFVRCFFFDQYRKNFDMIEIFEHVFVLINHRFDWNVYFDIQINLIFFQQICIVWHYLCIVLYCIRNTCSSKSSILKKIKCIIQIRNIDCKFWKAFNAFVVFVMIYDVKFVFTILVNYMLFDQLEQNFVEFKRYNNLNSVINVRRNNIVFRMINEQYINMK